MSFIRDGYICRKTGGGRNPNGRGTYRDWWLIKYKGKDRSGGYVALQYLSLPDSFVGRKVRFKIEMIEEEQERGRK